MAHEFCFRTVWRSSAPPGAVFAALAAGDDYPSWWPQFRHVQRHTANAGTATVRSLLPYSLSLTLTREVEDAATGLLRVRIAGDLTGWSSFTVAGDPSGGARASYAQVVELTAPGLRRLAGPAGGVLRLNHRWMMRSGERGLQAHLTPRS